MKMETPKDTNSNPQPQTNPFTSITTEHVQKLNSMLESLSPNDGEGTTTERPTIEYFDTFPTRDELTYYKGRLQVEGRIAIFTGRIKGMHVFIGNFTYVIDFMIVEDISSILDPRLTQVVLGRPFIEISDMTHDPPEGVVRFIKGTDEVAYKMPHKIEQYDSLSDLEKEQYQISVILGRRRQRERS
ncbi:hypothetical protein Tco_0627154 [Tanacetum coccineum]|uniref:Protein kinase-like domain, concanavalin A-like lectin/glucanase domain protein n=1 Tax=Tanacetum coccineum TaxID=301880 RepID=A0ABQ4WLK5_9ASTR